MKRHERTEPGETRSVPERRKLRKRLMVFWVMLTLVVFGGILLVLALTGLLSNSGQWLGQGLAVRLESGSSGLQSDMDELTGNALRFAEEARREIEGLLVREGLAFDDLNDDQVRLLDLQRRLCGPLDRLTRTSDCSGAYVVLDVTANTALPGAERSRTGLYLRAASLDGSLTADRDLCFFRGIPEVARERELALHNRWNPEFDVGRLPGWDEMLRRQGMRPADCFYWSERVGIQDTWEEAILLCVPVTGTDGQIYGMCGVEVSAHFFRLAVPVQSTEFGPVTLVLAPLEDGKLQVDQGLVGGVSGTYLDQPEELAVHQGRSFNRYTGGATEYVGVQRPLDVPLEDGEERQWAAALLLPRDWYESYTAQSHRRLALILMGVLAVLILVSGLLYLFLVRPVRRKDPGQWAEGGDLGSIIAYVQARPPEERLSEGPLPPEIEGTLFRFVYRASQLPPEEKKLLRLLCEGCPPEDLGPRTGQSRRLVHRQLMALCDGLEILSVDGILFYLDFFRRCGREDALLHL